MMNWARFDSRDLLIKTFLVPGPIVVKYSILLSLFLLACNLSDDSSSQTIPNQNDLGETCNEDCINGSCVEDKCVCEDGFAGQDCSICAFGLQDKDKDGSCLKSWENLPCVNGECVDEVGEAHCICLPLFEGELCDTCENGKQDNDNNGSCLPDCENIELDCGAATCDDSAGKAHCLCPLGTQITDEMECKIVVPPTQDSPKMDGRPTD